VDIALLPLDLPRWDQAPGGDLFVVFVATDVRPLRGAPGLLDWRLNGKLSACLRDERFLGARGEKLLLPTQRIPWQAVLAVGVGPGAAFDEAGFREALTTVARAARGLAQRRLAIALPGRELGKIETDRAVTLLQDLFSGGEVTALTLVDTAAALKTIGDRLGLPGPARRSQPAQQIP
jgi:hypothetical protein